ncbi:hypothetical protein ACTXT7_015790 [Hymenolepis weldensis]
MAIFVLRYVIDQTEELRELKRIVYQVEIQKKLDKTIDSDHWKTTIEQLKADQFSSSTSVRRRWLGVEASKPFDERSVHEEPIQPVEKKKILQFKTFD